LFLSLFLFSFFLRSEFDDYELFAPEFREEERSSGVSSVYSLSVEREDDENRDDDNLDHHSEIAALNQGKVSSAGSKGKQKEKRFAEYEKPVVAIMQKELDSIQMEKSVEYRTSEEEEVEEETEDLESFIWKELSVLSLEEDGRSEKRISSSKRQSRTRGTSTRETNEEKRSSAEKKKKKKKKGKEMETEIGTNVCCAVERGMELEKGGQERNLYADLNFYTCPFSRCQVCHRVRLVLFILN
tara:strand:+ start:253 stop:978 length:726 start_codon:yes stop_codon:yes gene_type:complete